MRFREDLTLMTAAARMVNVVGAVTPDGILTRSSRNTRTGFARISHEPGPCVDGAAVQIRLLALSGFALRPITVPPVARAG